MNPVLRWTLLVAGALVALLVLMAVIGLMMPKAHTASRSTTLNVPPDKVFARISDFARYPEWRPDVKEVIMLDAPDGAIRFREIGKDGPVAYRVVSQDYPSRLVVRIDDASLPYGGTWTYTLRSEGSGTLLTITENGEVYNPIFRFLSRTVFSPAATIEKFLAAVKGREGGNAK